MRRVIAIGLAAILAIVALFCTYTVKEWEQALILEFGEYKRVVNGWNNGGEANAGLKFKLPYETVVIIERRKIAVDVNAVTVLDVQRKPLEVDSYILYEITDPLKYYQALGDKRTAEIRLIDLMDSKLRGVLGGVDSQQIISGRRADLMNEIKNAVNEVARGQETQNSDGEVDENVENYGVSVTDVRIQKVELPNDVKTSVFNRMQSDFEKQAAFFKAEGVKKENEIKADADRQARIILAEAEGKAQTLRGEGDSESNQIYNEAYGADPEFFAFYRSMEAYKRALSEGTTYVLSPDSDFLSYLDSKGGRRR